MILRFFGFSAQCPHKRKYNVSREQSTALVVPTWRRALMLGSLLIVLDAFYLNQGGIALFVGLWLLVISLPRTFLVKRFVTIRRQRLRNITIYLAAVIMVFAFNGANNTIAKRRAEVLISAVKAFHAKNRQYPEALENLVPYYIQQVPLAKYTLMFNQFSYSASGQDATLLYFEVPPFGRPTYSFARNKWTYLD